MTILDNENDQLHIIIKTTAPDEERERIMNALLAAVRWYCLSDDEAKYNVNKVDQNNLYTLAELHESLLKTE
jgi:hypothetical protein